MIDLFQEPFDVSLGLFKLFYLLLIDGELVQGGFGIATILQNSERCYCCPPLLVVAQVCQLVHKSMKKLLWIVSVY